MNVLIISTNRNRFPMPVMPIGACLVAESAERMGHRVAFLDMMFLQDPLGSVTAAIKETRPDVIGISVRNIDNNDRAGPVFFIDALRPLMAAIRRETDAVTILGGAAVSVMPGEILEATGADAAATGDGEMLFPQLLDRISTNRSYDDLPGVVVPGGSPVHHAPRSPAGLGSECLAPAYSRWIDVRAYQEQMATAPVQSKQGCPFQCVYCTYRKIEGRTFRTADPAAVADRVAELAARGTRDIEFVDSVFNAPADHAMEVCEVLARTRHKARIQSLELNPTFFNDGLLTTMERAGFVGYGLTVESASDPVLAGLRKGFTAAEVQNAADIVRRHKLPCAWIFLLGGPGETQETVRETLRFAERSIRKSDVVFFNIGIRIYPATGLDNIARSQGLLDLQREDMLAPVFYLSPEVDGGWLVSEVRGFMAGHMNVINADTLSLPILPMVNRAGFRLGLRPPLWKHTRFIRRGLRMAGMDV
ncbi:MAG: cobalamin-dependent protein [Nitrospirota bacterium]|nr:cobalamin-dependent protein [Nitrospirota bacterium]